MRDLSPSHERCSLSRTLVGFPPVVTLVASISSSSRQTIEQRIQALVQAYPLLACSVADARTRQPRFQPLDQSDEALARSIIRDVNVKTSVQDIFLKEIADKIDIETQPLWRLSFYPHEGPDRNYLALSANHILTDGRGLANLLQALLSDSQLPSTPRIAPKLEDLHSVKPQTFTLLKAAFHHFVKPHLPLFLQPAEKLFWPTSEAILKRPAKCEDAVRVFSIPASVMSSIRQQAKDRQDIKTLQPVIFAVTQLSLLQAIGETPRSLLITGSTPKALRPAHVAITGNYTGTVSTNVLTTSTASIWELAATHRQALDKSTTASELDTLGLLAHVPDSPTYTSSEYGTEWESFFASKLEKHASFTGTFELSNLGKVDVEEVWFSQVANPGEEAMHVNVISGSDGKLGVVVSYRKGSVDESVMDKIVERFQEVMKEIAEGQA